MKSISNKILFGLVFALAGWIPLHGANTMMISSASVGPNQNFSIHVDINNSNAFVAFQFDLPLPAGFSYVTGSALLDPARVSGHLLEASIIPGNKLRVLGYSNNNIPFIGNAGSVVSFQLTSGVVPGAYPLTLTIPMIGDTNMVNILTGSTNGTATMLAPDINITATLVDFIRTPLGSTTDKILTIYNTGNQPLNVTGVSCTSAYFSVIGSSVFSISAGQSYNLQIRFTSVVKGTYDKKIIITTNDPDELTWQVDLHARAYAVNELRTGNMFAYSGHQGTLAISINNMEPFTGFQFDLVLPSSMTYVNNSAMLSIRKSNHAVSVNTIPGNKLRVVVHSPTGQVFSGVNGNVLSLTFDVNGIGGTYGLNLQNVLIGDTLAQNSISDSYNGTLTIAAADISSNTQVNFGNVSVVETDHQTLRIYNYGTDTLKVDQITFSNPSYTHSTALPFNVLVNQYKDITVNFHQTSRGQSNGIIKVFSNDPDEYPYIVNLTANAFIPNYIIIPSLSARYIDTVNVPVKITKMEAAVGFQFDIEFPSFMSYIQNSAVLSGRAQGHIVVTEAITANKVRVVSYSPAQNPISGDTGTVVTLRFAIQATNNQTSATLTLSNGVLGNVLMQNILWGTMNGIIVIKRPHALNGTFTYNNATSIPLDSLWVFIKQNGITIDSVQSASNGSYFFPQIFDGTYTISAATHKPWGGVNGADGLKIMRHFTGLEDLTIPVRKTAADVNNTININGTDAVKVQLRFVGIDSTFARGDWTFEKHGGGDTVIMAGVNQTVNFYGLCVGDVNGSHIPAPGAKNTYDLELIAEKILMAGNGQELYLPVSIDMDESIGALSLDLDYPKELITIEEVTTMKGVPFFQSKDGNLKAVWADLNPIRTLPYEPIAYIKVKTSDQFYSGSKVQFRNGSEMTEFADRDGNPIHGLKVFIPEIQYTSDIDKRSLIICPNPAKQYTSVIFRLTEVGQVSLVIYDLLGRQIQSYNVQSNSEGLNKLDLNVSNLAKGEYILELQFDGKTESTRQIGRLIVTQ